MQRTDHRLAVQFAVPAAFYRPGAGSVVRLTAGRTPAASPSKGYAVATDGRHVARTAATSPLVANTYYTFAVWIRHRGVYSKRITITTRTRPDTTRPNPVTGLTAKASIGDGSGQVTLTWTGDHTDRMGYVRIVRNVDPTTTGGEVVAARLPAGTESWTDTKIGPRAWSEDAGWPGPGNPGFNRLTYYYFVIERDQAGNFSRSYANTSTVLGSQRLSGTVTFAPGDGGQRTVSAFAGRPGALKLVGAFAARPDFFNGSFQFDVPPGLYTVCDSSNIPGPDGQDATGSCWVVRQDGTPGTVPYPGTSVSQVPTPSIDVTRGDYTAIRFTANAD
ncbi:hypothetical protein [Aeromicrobium sp. IC_218]|uniref:hypothetical protein n=1 Tax=Aeromicrobium sp. IC_218 TaxID=2545468 RepID=UPI00103B170C|nr:hypothetical protein [Aeromicrobium sp. IC_218]